MVSLVRVNAGIEYQSFGYTVGTRTIIMERPRDRHAQQFWILLRFFFGVEGFRVWRPGGM